MKNLFAIAILLLTILVACTSTQTIVKEVPQEVLQEEAPSIASLEYYQNTLEPILDQKCRSCHRKNHSFKNYEESKIRINAMIKRINSTSSSMMPPARDGVPLSDAEKEVFTAFKELVDTEE